MDAHLVPVSSVPPQDHSHFIPWSLAMIYAVEPSLETIRRRAFDQALLGTHKRRAVKKNAVNNAFVEARNSSDKLIGWNARDPRLRSSEAYEFYIYGLKEALEKEFLK